MPVSRRHEAVTCCRENNLSFPDQLTRVVDDAQLNVVCGLFIVQDPPVSVVLLRHSLGYAVVICEIKLF